MTEQKKRTFNIWKRRFFILLALNIVGFLLINLLIFWPTSFEERRIVRELDGQDSSEFIVRTTKKNLNELVNAYIDKFLHGTNHKYSISLDKDVHLIGELPVFSTTVPLSVHLEPIVQDNGDVIYNKSRFPLDCSNYQTKKLWNILKNT